MDSVNEAEARANDYLIKHADWGALDDIADAERRWFADLDWQHTRSVFDDYDDPLLEGCFDNDRYFAKIRHPASMSKLIARIAGGEPLDLAPGRGNR